MSECGGKATQREEKGRAEKRERVKEKERTEELISKLSLNLCA